MVRIKSVRLSRSTTQTELLERGKIKLPPPYYSLIENGKVLPTPEVLTAICETLKCLPSDLYSKARDYDLAAVQTALQGAYKSISGDSNVTRFDTLPKANPRIQVRLPIEKIEALESDLHILGYSCFGSYVRKVIIPEVRREASEKVKKMA